MHYKGSKKIFMVFMVFVLFLYLQKKPVFAISSNNIGIDVSYHNGWVDWTQVLEQDISFVMIKTGDGQEPEEFEKDKDSQFEANYYGANEVGIKRGAYHLCCTRTPEGARKEAEYCLKILEGRPLEYPIAYDMEQAGTFEGGKENTTAIAKAFCEVIEEAGYTPMIYSSSSHLKEDFNWDELKDYKIWVAHYDVEEPSYEGVYDIWQYTKNGDVQGANTNNGKNGCDINYSFMEAESIKLNKSEITMGVDETFTFTAKVSPVPCTDSIRWSTSDKSVISITQSGKMTAKKAGKAEITVKTGSGLLAKCMVTVKKAPSSISANIESKNLKVGKTFQLAVKLPKGTASNRIVYKSSNQSIATVNTKGLITAKKKGTTYITIKTFNKQEVRVKIVVKD